MTDTQPTYTEARIARRLVDRHAQGELVDPYDLEQAQDVLARRGAFLARAHRNSPTYRPPEARISARKEPERWLEAEVRRCWQQLENMGRMGNAKAIEAIRSLRATFTDELG